MKRDSSGFDGLVTWLSQQYGAELGLFLARRLAKAIRSVKDECLDNFRVCDVASADEVARYERQRASGCCGCKDIEVTHFASGRTFRLGFNHGH